MECVAAKAFKTKFWPETTAFKPNQQVVFEDFWVGNGPNGGVSVDEFVVEEFLDFSKEEGFVLQAEQHKEEEEEEEEEEEDEDEEEKDCLSVSSQEQNSNSNNDFGFVSVTEFSVPTDDMADLEWLSQFVDDSFSEFALPYPPIDSPQKPQIPGPAQFEPDPETKTSSSSLKPTTFPTRFPAKPRTKRSKTTSRVWSTEAPSLTETSTTTTTSSSASSSPSSSSTSCLIFTNTTTSLEFLDYIGAPAQAKKQRRNPSTKSSINGTQSQRRCSHCGVQKTPQWRFGPLGAKTLCNACGVRFKSGRLLPEYRPACSPTFSSEVHSNSHRKVLEMRLKKEMGHIGRPGSELVHSF